jgi:hypothetical protein
MTVETEGTRAEVAPTLSQTYSAPVPSWLIRFYQWWSFSA